MLCIVNFVLLVSRCHIAKLRPVQEYFKNLVNDTVETSVKSVRAYVHHYLADKIETARARISAYGKSYASVMRGAVEMKSRSTFPLHAPFL